MMPKVTVGTVRKSIAIVPARWVRRKVLQVCDRGRGGRSGGFGMYFATVSLLTACPSLATCKRRANRPKSAPSHRLDCLRNVLENYARVEFERIG
jgi:hypothetical protein